jgi:hypothetical protein
LWVTFILFIIFFDEQKFLFWIGYGGTTYNTPTFGRLRQEDCEFEPS